MKLTGADIVVRTLIEQGTDVVFGYPGGQILNVYDSLYKYRSEIKHILVAHEQGAAHAADGYARATGGVGVVVSTSGPGATNLVTGIATAHLDSIPMVIICGNVPTSQIGSDSFQEIDITGITLPITKHNYFVSDVKELAETIREAFVLAKSGRPGPVLVDIPKDVQVAKCEYTKKDKVAPMERFSAKDIRISDAADCINNCKRPYIYFGGGIVSGQACDELLALADKIDGVIGCSLMGLSAIPTNHHRFLGMQGMHGHYSSTMAMAKADCIIGLGVRFNDRVIGEKCKFSLKAKVVHIDVDGSELAKNITEAHSLRGDVKLTLNKLIPLLEEKKRPEWQERVAQIKEEESEFADNRQGMTPKNIINLVNKIKTENTPVVTDVGQHQMWSAQNLIFNKERKFISSGGLGTMGFGLGAAIGAYFGTKERIILVTGDGGFGMCLNELATAVSNKTPITILIMNNGVLGMVRQMQSFFFDKRYSGTVLDRKTDFSALAKAFGADGEPVDTIDGVKSALKKAFSVDGPYIIDCKIQEDELVLPMLPPGGSMEDIIVKVEDEI